MSGEVARLVWVANRVEIFAPESHSDGMKVHVLEGFPDGDSVQHRLTRQAVFVESNAFTCDTRCGSFQRAFDKEDLDHSSDERSRFNHVHLCFAHVYA